MEQKTKETPLISVIMPAYNAEKYISQAIGSVLAQTEQHWELLVIDDCSGDKTVEIVERFVRQDERIRLLINEQNQGTAYSRNRGFDLCRGAYVALLDSDDLWRPEKLEKQLAYAERSGADLIYTSYALIDGEEGSWLRDYRVPESTSLDKMLLENMIGCSTVLLRRELIQKFRFTTQFFHEDYAMWLGMLRSGYRAAGVTEVLVDYRLHRNSRAANKFRAARNRWEIYRSMMGLSVGKSLSCLLHYSLSGIRKYRKI